MSTPNVKSPSSETSPSLIPKCPLWSRILVSLLLILSMAFCLATYKRAEIFKSDITAVGISIDADRFAANLFDSLTKGVWAGLIVMVVTVIGFAMVWVRRKRLGRVFWIIAASAFALGWLLMRDCQLLFPEFKEWALGIRRYVIPMVNVPPPTSNWLYFQRNGFERDGQTSIFYFHYLITRKCLALIALQVVLLIGTWTKDKQAGG